MRRSLARRGLLMALLAIVVIATGVLQAIASLSVDAATAATTTTLAEAPPTAAALRVTTALGGDSPSNPFDFGDLPLRVSRSVVSDPVGGIILEASPEIAEHARLVSGSWGAALQARAAENLGLAVGDEVELDGGLSVRITGTWLPVDGTEGFWFGDPAAASGHSGDAAGPLVVNEDVVAGLPSQLAVHWTIVPTSLTPELLPAMAAALAGVEEQAATVTVDYLTVEGTLDETVAELQGRLAAAARLETVPVALVAVIATVTLARVAALLWSVRRGESALLRARGARRRLLLAGAAVEALVVVVLGAAPFAVLSPWISLAVAGAAFAVLCAVAWRGIDTASPHTERTRATLAVTTGGTVLAALVAALTLWQFLLYSGDAGANPFGALAPAAGLLALSLFALLGVPALFAMLERLAARRPGLAPVYPARQIARDAVVHATSIVLIVLVVGATALAAGYSGTATAREASAFANENGADVRARLSLPAEGFVPIELWADVDGEIESVVATPALIARDAYEFVARTSPEEDGQSGSTSFRLRSGATGHLDLGVWMADQLGQPRRVDAGRIEVPFDGEVPVTLPTGEWTLLAVEAKIGGITGDTVATVVVDDLPPLDLTIAHPSARAMLERSLAPRLEITLSDAAAALLGANPGDEISLELPAAGASVDAVVAATTPVVAGTHGSMGIAADLRELTDYLLRSNQRVAEPSELWIITDDPAAAAASVVEVSPYAVSVTTRASGASLAAPTSTILWLGVLGSAALCVIAASAVAAALGRLREGERLVLTALGVSARRREGIRFAEFAAVVAAAVLCGLLAGGVAAALYSPTLAASALVFDAWPFALVVGALTLACLAVGATASRRSA